ncbi:SusC/RagA family TonB-linked outer membrane protein [Sphingobacterium chuzhouense]|uniref:TonB-dependent receptor n=1 Tax=Sphingobacterium chuzhouense TaxID=1742264 RepID=A0ABR7XMX0_9SPHI|nr:TonB-dependent receptor [Sphingobacterium chuzhouense]MBD1420520.1 TonB-dependent receptor [Sphingobacterium chuzhouense]
MGRSTKRWLLCATCSTALFFAFPAISKTPVPMEHAQDFIRVSGQVLSSSGGAIGGATIRYGESETSADQNGRFTIQLGKPGNVVFSAIGHVSKTVSVTADTELTVVLEADGTALDEVVVVGYGVQRRSNVSGSLATVDGKTLNERPVPNAANMLQGRIPGLQVTQPSGEPGRDNPNLLIRGRGTFGGSSAPLVLIDGVAGSLTTLSPDDIENVTVLKDASSAAIYGSRAANGVILVTTKSGKRGATEVSYRVNVGRHTPTALPDFITNSVEYMEMYNEAAFRSGITFRYEPEWIDAYRNATDREQYPNFDAVDYYINPATTHNHNLSISGGGEKNTFNLSLGYLDQKAMIKGYDFKRYNALLNYTNELSDYVKVGTVVNATYRDRQEPPFTGENMALAIYASGPLYGPFLPDGSGRVVSRAYQQEGRNRNPQEYYAMGNQFTKDYNVNAQAFIDVKPFKDLVWTTKFALNYEDQFYKMHQVPYDAYLSQERDEETGDYIRSTFGPDVLGVTDQYSKALTPTIYSVLNYNTQFGNDHNFSALAGYEQVSYSIQSLRGRRTNTVYPDLTDLRGYLPTGETLYFNFPRLPGLINPSEWALQSFFGRVGYNYKEKYFLESNLRYDGTSKVSPEYRWGVFPSFSGAWLASKEDFVQSALPWVSELKLRTSYGILGNQDIGTYLYQNNLDIQDIYYSFDNEELSSGAVVNVFRDQSLRWESTSIFNVGFDFALKNRLLEVNFDWFNKTAYNILAEQPVPASLGLGKPTTNDGKMRNKGIELVLAHHNRIGEVSYSVNGMISTARNELLHIRVPEYGTRIKEVGQPYDAHYLWVWDGIFQEGDVQGVNVPIHDARPESKPGDLKMKDINGDGIVNADDRVVVDGAYPKYMYSFGLNMGYKNFNLSAFFQGVEGLKNRVENWGIDPFMQGTPPTTEWRNAWTPENRSNELPGIYVAGYPGVAAYKGSTYYLRDASYLRLKNIMLSYDFPLNWVQSAKLKGAQIYFSADNLFTITDYKGADPERSQTNGNFAQYPQAKIFNIGANIRF